MKRLSFEIGDNRAEVKVRQTPRQLTRKRAFYAHAPRVTIPTTREKKKGETEREREREEHGRGWIHREYSGCDRSTERERNWHKDKLVIYQYE